VSVIAINPHQLSIEIFTKSGLQVRPLYAGPNVDSVAVLWDYRGAGGARVAAGDYQIVVTARADDGKVLNVVRVPVVVESRVSASGR
jgi:hypothetical protein